MISVSLLLFRKEYLITDLKSTKDMSIVLENHKEEPSECLKYSSTEDVVIRFEPELIVMDTTSLKRNGISLSSFSLRAIDN